MYTKGGGNYSECKDIDPWVTPPAPVATPAASPAARLKERVIKMSSLIDQSDDSEFVLESLAKADAWYQRYLRIMGGTPQEEEDCTVEQLSALNKRAHTLDLPPYVCLTLRQVGTGPEVTWPKNCQDQHRGAAWRVFQTAAKMLDILPIALLQLCERHVEIGQALPLCMAPGGLGGREGERREVGPSAAQDLNGHRARQEGDLSYGTPYGPVRSERRQEGEARHAPAEETYNATQASGSDFDPGAAIRRRTTKEKRQAKKQRIRADNDKEDLKAFRATAAGKGKQEGKGDKNGRLKSKDQAGGDLCFSRDSAKGPCKYCSPGEGCKGKIKRFHKCRICLSRGHRSQDCPQRA